MQILAVIRRASAAFVIAVLSALAASPAAAQNERVQCTLPLNPVPVVLPQGNVGITKLDREIYYDTDGLIVHRDPDGKCNGGDTAQREGWYWFGVWIRQHTTGMRRWKPRRQLTFDQVIALLEPNRDGVFYRHPKLEPWNHPYDKEWGTSRDQLIPLIAALGVWNKTDALDRLWDALPQDAQGKHAFNGNWRNALGQDGWDCRALKQRSCGGTMDCSLRQDNRDCSLQVDNKDCSAGEDKRECSQPHDERGCGHWWGNDPFCEAAKAAQNAAYDAAKATCEASKATQNAAYAVSKATCEAEKSTQNGLYAQSKLTCEAEKTSQNASYSSLKGLCETAKTGGKYACEAYKAGAQAACLASNIFNGDLFGPAEINLFMRSLKINPMLPPVRFVTATVVQGGPPGEAQLPIMVALRNKSSSDPDDVGNDLNGMVELIMAKLRFPTTLSDAATREYAAGRSFSYGSYLDDYQVQYGADCTDQKARMKAGVAGGWKPTVSAAYGAVLWYHRPCSGANPRLAYLFAPIIAHYIH